MSKQIPIKFGYSEDPEEPMEEHNHPRDSMPVPKFGFFDELNNPTRAPPPRKAMLAKVEGFEGPRKLIQEYNNPARAQNNKPQSDPRTLLKFGHFDYCPKLMKGHYLPDRKDEALPPSSKQVVEDFPRNHTKQVHLATGDEASINFWSHTPTGCLFVVKTMHYRYRPIHKRSGKPNEVSILKNLPRHENVIRCIGYTPYYGSELIFLEYLPEKSLGVVKINQGVQFAEKAMWGLFSQLCAALAFLHEGVGAPAVSKDWKPVLHRDINCDNILVETLGTPCDLSEIKVKMADFGIACVYDKDHTELPMNDNGFMGSPLMWPPETTARYYGPEADVWGIGAVIHELAHGFAPVQDPQDRDNYIRAGEQHCDKYEKHPEETFPFPWSLESVTPRRPLPINLHPSEHKPDGRRMQDCLVYSDKLNTAMMMALQMEKEERPTAGVLNIAVDRMRAWSEFTLSGTSSGSNTEVELE